jgi:hypothetical protein
MADATDILLKHIEAERAQAIHCETQRAVMTNMFLVIAAAA